MAQESKGSFQVEIDGRRRYISVPVGRAMELHDYLRSNKVHSAPPEPAFTGFDSIELALDTDVAVVQAILNQFNRSRPGFQRLPQPGDVT